jgi:hypothetical protein
MVRGLRQITDFFWVRGQVKKLLVNSGLPGQWPFYERTINGHIGVVYFRGIPISLAVAIFLLAGKFSFL